jgi:hypothetical protein
MTIVQGVPAVTATTGHPPRGVGPEIRAWHLSAKNEHPLMFAVEFLATGDLYVVDYDTMVAITRRSSRWTLNQDG